ncbi:hypothetical protein IL306_013678 [Fusarium sp. DS 682]|nr:hypothetical protein IL306_013678 [Fusarium sp. DS 682]
MIPGPLDRYFRKPVHISGVEIPKGVIASTAAKSQGMLADVYPQPGEWDPARWIESTDRMRNNWIPFGTGSRACPGANLAVTELKYMVGKIMRCFDLVIPPGFEEDTLELADVFAAGSRSGHCWLKFIKDQETAADTLRAY